MELQPYNPFLNFLVLSTLNKAKEEDFKLFLDQLYNMAKRRVTFYTDKRKISIIARNYLLSKNIEFEEVDTTKREGFDRLIKETRQKITPFLDVRGSGRHTSSGFDEFLYAVALDSTLSYDRFIAQKQEENRKRQRML